MKVNRLKELRLKNNISGVEIANYLNISPQYYYDLEKGKRRLNVELAEKIANYYGITTDYLLGYDDNSNPTDAGIDELSAAEIMGHDVIIMRSIYTHIQEARKHKTAAKIDTLYKNKD